MHEQRDGVHVNCPRGCSCTTWRTRGRHWSTHDARCRPCRQTGTLPAAPQRLQRNGRPRQRGSRQPRRGRRHCGRAATRLCLDHFRNFTNTAYQARDCHAQWRRKRAGYSTAPGTPPCSTKDLNFRSVSEDRESESRHDHISSSTFERT